MVDILLQKYGPSQYDYFCNESCKSKNKKTSRSNEGLFLHHIDENKEILLSSPDVAAIRPFAYQRADRLVYANYLEHLILHIKIVEEDNQKRGLGLGGVIMISSAISDYYRHKKAIGWKINAVKCLIDNYDQYISILKYFQDFVAADPILSRWVLPPMLVQGWYGQVNQQAHKDLYGRKHFGPVKVSNQDLLNFLEKKHRKEFHLP